jgi:hypothetical protein
MHAYREDMLLEHPPLRLVTQLHVRISGGGILLSSCREKKLRTGNGRGPQADKHSYRRLNHGFEF